MPKKSQPRSLDLIANFVDGFAEGWAFRVGDFFRDQLDIKIAERKEGDNKVLIWTQGPFYCFDIGHFIYSSNDPTLAVQVQRAVPNRASNEGELIKGTVTFIIYKFNEDGSYRETLGQYHLTQDDFVEFLKTGDLDKEKATLNP